MIQLDLVAVMFLWIGDFFQLAVMSAFLGPDQLATENLLSSDPEVRPWVEKYQRSRETISQTDYEVMIIQKIISGLLLFLAFTN